MIHNLTSCMHSYTEEIQRGVTAVLDNIKVHMDKLRNWCASNWTHLKHVLECLGGVLQYP